MKLSHFSLKIAKIVMELVWKNGKLFPLFFFFHIRRVKYDEKRVTKIKRKIQIPEGFSIGLDRYKISSVTSHIGDSTKEGHWLTDLR